MSDQDGEKLDITRREFLKLSGAAALTPLAVGLDELQRKIDGLAKPIPEEDDSREKLPKTEVEKVYDEIRQSRKNIDRFFEGMPDLEELVVLPQQVYSDTESQAIIYRPAVEREILYELERIAADFVLDLKTQHKMEQATYKEVSDLFKKLIDGSESKFPGLYNMFHLMNSSFRVTYLTQEVISRWHDWEGIRFHEIKGGQPQVFGDALSDLLEEYPVPGNVRDDGSSDHSYFVFGETNSVGNITTYVEDLLTYMESLNDGKPLTQEQKEEAMKSVICHELAHAFDVCVNANLIGFIDKKDLQVLYTLRLKAFSAIKTIDQIFPNYKHPEQMDVGDQLVIALAQGRTITDPKQLHASAISYSAAKFKNYVYSFVDKTGIHTFFEQNFPDLHLPLDEFLTGEWKKHIARDDVNAEAYDLIDFILTRYNEEIKEDLEHTQVDENDGRVIYNDIRLTKDDTRLPILAKALSGRIVQALFSGEYDSDIGTVLLRQLCVGVPITADAEYLGEACGAELFLNQTATTSAARTMLNELQKLNPYHNYLAAVLTALGDNEVSAIFDRVVAKVSTAYQVAMEHRNEKPINAVV